MLPYVLRHLNLRSLNVFRAHHHISESGKKRDFSLTSHAVCDRQQLYQAEMLDFLQKQDCSEGRLFGSTSYSDSYGHCCPPVFDPYTLVALVGGIALATYFLRIVIITTEFPMNKRSMAGYFGESLFRQM